ncbi:hypothetical protein GOZ78_18770 [Agrobacterium vitis]|uniref:Uncharacterized protein n=1 Tax=Agrobacterium vitis TaxID=373 RepID=A0AAE4WCS9_AGRVI|nr:hypothetical protein [Agrobacterium vitis]MCM2440178.1 hypothetical protein [Agrobacterium vitis]MUO79515.1 hypothetical protein [Agrobacterium vitis]MUO95962.1 hypothetical protein [Agrobacterium vitis]MUP06642.1 hypothetical protein [Agrobacterium vitis]MUZ57974.1 hypothetical protein [Agrobacterium vitis]
MFDLETGTAPADIADVCCTEGKAELFFPEEINDTKRTQSVTATSTASSGKHGTAQHGF